MTNATQEVNPTEAALEAIDNAVEVIEEAVEVIERDYQGYNPEYFKPELSQRAADYAAKLSAMTMEPGKSIRRTEKEFYEVVKSDISREDFERVRSIEEDYVNAVHAVASNEFLKRATGDKTVEEMKVSAKIGKSTTYEDNYRRFDSRSVSGGKDAERRQQDTYGYHNPRIKTEYKGFNESRVSVHNLAKDLLG